MWMHVAEIANPPLAILIGFVFGRRARLRGESPWAAYALALIPGCLLAIVSHFWFGTDVKTFPDSLVWLAWTGFGTYTGWRGERKRPTVYTLNLSGREPQL